LLYVDTASFSGVASVLLVGGIMGGGKHLPGGAWNGQNGLKSTKNTPNDKNSQT